MTTTSCGTYPKRHHAIELSLNACGVECCPHSTHRGLVAVASYLHRPGGGEDDEPGTRVGQLYLYDLSPVRLDGERDLEGGSNRDGSEPARWNFAPVAKPLDTSAIFELAWAPASWTTEAGPVLAQADARGFLALYRVCKEEGGVDGDGVEDVDGVDGVTSTGDDGVAGMTYKPVPLTSLQCGGGGLCMTTCVAWSRDGDESDFKSTRLAVTGADGGLRIIGVTDSGSLAVVTEKSDAHSLEAWACAFANPLSFHGGGNDVVFTGADDARFKAWDVRVGNGEPVLAFSDKKTHMAGVTCVSPSPHDPHVVCTGSYDDVVRLWDVRFCDKPRLVTHTKLGGGSWRARWHPHERRIAVAAMDGGAVVLDWDGREVVTEKKGVEAELRSSSKQSSNDDDDVSVTIVSTEFKVACTYDGHCSIAYGADWGWRGGDGNGREPDVVVSCSFYDKGLQVWTPPPRGG